jgi:hypothetical protein
VTSPVSILSRWRFLAAPLIRSLSPRGRGRRGEGKKFAHAGDRSVLIFFLIILIAPAHADDLGRLFYSPDERRALDSQRAMAALPTPPPPSVSTSDVDLLPETEPDLPPSAPTPLTVNGLVSRTHGSSTVWINGSSVEPGRAALSGIVDHPLMVRQRAVEFRPDSQRPQRVKPGQTYDPVTARVLEAYDQPIPIAAP